MDVYTKYTNTGLLVEKEVFAETKIFDPGDDDIGRIFSLYHFHSLWNMEI